MFQLPRERKNAKKLNSSTEHAFYTANDMKVIEPNPLTMCNSIWIPGCIGMNGFERIHVCNDSWAAKIAN